MSTNWLDLAYAPSPPKNPGRPSKPSAARIFNIDLYLEKLPKRFSDPRITEWLELVQKDYDATGDVSEKDFKRMWNMYVGTVTQKWRWLEDDIREKLNTVYNPVKPR